LGLTAWLKWSGFFLPGKRRERDGYFILKRAIYQKDGEKHACFDFLIKKNYILNRLCFEEMI